MRGLRARIEGAKFENITFGIRAEGLGLRVEFRV